MLLRSQAYFHFLLLLFQPRLLIKILRFKSKSANQTETTREAATDNAQQLYLTQLKRNPEFIDYEPSSEEEAGWLNNAYAVHASVALATAEQIHKNRQGVGNWDSTIEGILKNHEAFITHPKNFHCDQYDPEFREFVRDLASREFEEGVKC